MLESQQFNLKKLFLSHANSIAFRDNNLTYGEWLCEIAFYVEWFQQQSVTQNMIVPLLATNSVKVLSAIIALWELGAVPELISEKMPYSKNLIKELPSGSSPNIPNLKFDIYQKAVTIFTSGTTDRAKGVILSIGNLISSSQSVNSFFKLNETHIWKIPLSISRIGGLIIPFRTMLAGASFTFKNDGTHISLVPSQISQYAQKLKQYKAILIGGGPIPKSLRTNYSHLPLFYSYGMTEMSSTIAISNKSKVTILKGNSVKTDSHKNILVKGPALFQSYQDGTRLVDENGYFYTKDLGEFIDGKLRLIGRSDTVFISGGVNINPEIIEAALKELPDISDAIVLPKPHSKYGNIPICFISTNQPVNFELITESLKEKLHPYHIPKECYPIAGRSREKIKETLL